MKRILSALILSAFAIGQAAVGQMPQIISAIHEPRPIPGGENNKSKAPRIGLKEFDRNKESLKGVNKNLDEDDEALRGYDSQIRELELKVKSEELDTDDRSCSKCGEEAKQCNNFCKVEKIKGEDGVEREKLPPPECANGGEKDYLVSTKNRKSVCINVYKSDACFDWLSQNEKSDVVVKCSWVENSLKLKKLKEERKKIQAMRDEEARRKAELETKQEGCSWCEAYSQYKESIQEQEKFYKDMQELQMAMGVGGGGGYAASAEFGGGGGQRKPGFWDYFTALAPTIAGAGVGIMNGYFGYKTAQQFSNSYQTYANNYTKMGLPFLNPNQAMGAYGYGGGAMASPWMYGLSGALGALAGGGGLSIGGGFGGVYGGGYPGGGWYPGGGGGGGGIIIGGGGGGYPGGGWYPGGGGGYPGGGWYPGGGGGYPGGGWYPGGGGGGGIIIGGGGGGYPGGGWYPGGGGGGNIIIGGGSGGYPGSSGGFPNFMNYYGYPGPAVSTLGLMNPTLMPASYGLTSMFPGINGVNNGMYGPNMMDSYQQSMQWMNYQMQMYQQQAAKQQYYSQQMMIVQQQMNDLQMRYYQLYTGMVTGYGWNGGYGVGGAIGTGGSTSPFGCGSSPVPIAAGGPTASSPTSAAACTPSGGTYPCPSNGTPTVGCGAGPYPNGSPYGNVPPAPQGVPQPGR